MAERGILLSVLHFASRRTSRPERRAWSRGEGARASSGAGRRTPAGASHRLQQHACAAGTQASPGIASCHNGPTPAASSAVTWDDRTVILRSLMIAWARSACDRTKSRHARRHCAPAPRTRSALQAGARLPIPDHRHSPRTT
jgi:hypothetical protein